MPPALFRLGRLVLIVALFCAVGGHWAVLRTVAWSGMIIDYSRGASLAVAVEKTFSGKYPCGMCHSIEKSARDEKRSGQIVVLKKIDFFHETPRAFVAPIVSGTVSPLVDAAPTERSRIPALPPPRRA